MVRTIAQNVFDSGAHVIIALTCVGVSHDFERHHLVNRDMLYYARTAFSNQIKLKQEVTLIDQQGLCQMTESVLTNTNAGQDHRRAWIASCFSNEYQREGNTRWRSKVNPEWLRQSIKSLHQWISATGYPLRIAIQYMDGCMDERDWDQVLSVLNEYLLSYDVLICEGLILPPHLCGRH